MKITSKLQHVLSATAQILSNICKYDERLRHFWQSELHWLDVALIPV